MNGRVIFDNNPGTSYDLYQNEKQKYEFTDSLKGINEDNVLNKTFFSQKNIDMIQNAIINEVIKLSGYKIQRQSDLQLQIIMRSIFLQYSRNNRCNIKEQIIELDKKVIEFSVDRIIVEINQYMNYKNTINKLPTPLTHPENLSNKGEKSLRMNQFI